MIFLSIVIPAYNSEGTLGRLLTSIFDSRRVDTKEIEVIVVDDKSSDRTAEIARKNKVKVISLKENSGTAKASNIGVRQAKGKIVLFLDADVVLYRNTLSKIINSFKSDADLFALTGVWSREQKSRKFFPKFKAL